MIEKGVVFFLPERVQSPSDHLDSAGLQKLLRLQDAVTFRSDHPRKKNGIQLRPQIV